MVRVVTEPAFRQLFYHKLNLIKVSEFDYVTGPGRSGAVASVYASHFLGVPFVPYKCKIEGKKALVVDTAISTGKTLRKASRLYDNAPYVFAFNEPPNVKFWYEQPSILRGKGNEYP